MSAKAQKIPIGGDTFAVPLKATEAQWVRDAARLRALSPEALIRQLVAQARAADATKGGTVAIAGRKSDADASAPPPAPAPAPALVLEA